MTFSVPKTITTSLDSFAIIGNGSWATALVKIFSDNGNHVDWYVRKEEDLDYIKVPLNNKIIVSGVKGILPNSKMLVGVYLEKKSIYKQNKLL